ncbi:MAG: DUF4339 domain-containing protein [Bacteriovoracaceae bacterium]|jgi:hypothetical protein|nr:DUF4339 domain-containing protein [Bacteriovoracaceae bacterium]
METSVTDWFIYQGGGHRGPYKFHEIESKYNSGSLNAETFLWSEGLTDWYTFDEISSTEHLPLNPTDSDLFSDEIASEQQALVGQHTSSRYLELEKLMTKELVEMETEKIIKLQRGTGKKENFGNYLDFIENFDREVACEISPLIAGHQSQFFADENSPGFFQLKQDIDHGLIDVNRVVPQPYVGFNWELKKKTPWLSLAFLILGVTAGIFFHKYQSGNNLVDQTFKIKKPIGLPLNQFDKLKKTAGLVDLDPKVDFGFGKNLETIWMATNLPGKRALKLRLVSLQDEVLSMSQVEAHATGVLNSHMAKFSSFEMLSGKKIVPGVYKVMVEDRLYGEFGESQSEIFKVEKIFLLGFKNHSEFHKKLTKFRGKKYRALIMKLEDSKMQFLTVKEAINRYKDDFYRDLRLFKTGREFIDSTKNYQFSLGPLLTSFKMDSDKDYAKWKNIYPKLSPYYKALGRVSKGAAEMITSELSLLRSNKDLSLSTKARVKKRLRKNFRELEAEIQKRLEKIDVLEKRIQFQLEDQAH